eukprot:symbB.v1.2.001329.t1/scaffold57.1/size370615/38
MQDCPGAMRLALCFLTLQVAAGTAFVSPGLAGTARVEVLRAHGFEAKQQSRGTPAVALATCVAVGMVAMRLASSARRDSSVSMAAHRKPTKKGRKLVVLECSEQRQMVRDGIPGAGGPRGGVSRYYTEKNVRNTPELLKLRKFNKYLGRHTLHVELK